MGSCDKNCRNCDGTSCHDTISRKQSYVILLIIAAVSMLFAWWQSAKDTPAEADENLHGKSFAYPIMGTLFNAKFMDEDEAVVEKAAKAVNAALNDVDKTCSIFRKDSEFYQLSENAGKQPFVCSDKLYNILLMCRKANLDSEGSFDITVKPLMDLWGFYKKQNHVPTEMERLEAMKKVGFEKLVFDDAKKSVFFSVEGMALDLGGMAKGVAVDAAFNAAVQAGSKKFMLNLGGNIRVYNSIDKRPFKIGIRHPEHGDDILEVLEVKSEQGVATSGNYERFSQIGGNRFGHIMNPFTGKSAAELVSVTVLAKNGALADLYSTAVFAGGEKVAQLLVKNNPDLRIYIYKKNEQNQIERKEVFKP